MTPAVPSPGIRIVVFDLGGVVVRICRSIQEAGRLIGLDIPDADITPDRRAERKAIHYQYERGRLTCDEFFVAIARTTGGKYTPDQFRAMHEVWITGEYPGVAALIDDLHARRIDTGILSNTNASHWAQMQHTPGPDGRPTAPKFPTPTKPRHKHASHLLGLAKPERAIYAEFARLTGYTPSDILFFDDLADNIRAAREAGWHAHQIDHEGDTAAQMRSVLGQSFGIDL